MPDNPGLVLVTGTPRSGTMYVSKVLAAHGLDVAHEHPGADGAADYRLAADRSGRWRIVLHVVRHPVACVASMQTVRESSWNHMQADMSLDLVARGMECWVRWNRLAGQVVDVRFRVEDMEASLPRICEVLGVEPNPAALRAVPTDTNSRAGEYEPLTWADLHRADGALCRDVVAEARRYGYEELT